MTTRAVDIWVVDDLAAITEELQANYMDLLSDEEKSHHQRLRRQQDKLLYLTAKALTRIVLSEYYPEITPKQWLFEIGPHGKPRIKNTMIRPLHFNLSHTHSLIGLALQYDHSVGIDVENHNRTNNLESVAKQVFTKAEQDYLNSPESTNFRDRFFKLWTLKEAFVKATGEGITAGLKSFEFCFTQDEIKVSGKNQHTQKSWSFYHQKYAQDYSLAVAVPLDSGAKELTFNFHKGIPLKFFETCPAL